MTRASVIGSSAAKRFVGWRRGGMHRDNFWSRWDPAVHLSRFSPVLAALVRAIGLSAVCPAPDIKKLLPFTPARLD